MSALTLESLRVRRMPGIGDGGFELDGLSAGLNVVHGPNASGKTTAARSIEALLWPRTAPDHAWLSATVGIAGTAWSVSLDRRQTRWQRDGVDASAAVLPADEARDRYRISLHELLAADDAGFAQAIARESAGGYDLGAAALALDPRTSASRCTKEIAALKEARSRLQEASAVQETLFGEERRLRDMEQRLATRATIAARIRLLEQAIEHARARDAAARAILESNGFDSRMERLHGDEAERLRSIAGKLGAARGDALAAERDEQRALLAASACRLRDSGLPADLLPALRHELEALREQERLIATHEQALRAAGARRERERDSIGIAVDPARLAALSADGVGCLSELAKDAEEVAARRAALEGESGALRQGDGPARDRAALERGTWLLRQWLRSGPAGEGHARRLRMLGTSAALALVAACLGLALVRPLLAATALIGVALLVMIHRAGAEPDPRPVHQAEFVRLGLPEIAPWTAETVERRLAELEADVAAARSDEDRARRRAEIAARLEAMGPREREIEARRREIAGQLGVEPGTASGSLVWLVERIGRWHDAHAEAEGTAGALAEARAQLADGLRRVSGRVAAYAPGAIGSVADLAGMLGELEQRQQSFASACGQLEAARERRASSARSIQLLEEDQAEIFTRLGLGADDAAIVDAWCAERDRYLSAVHEGRRTAALRDAEAERLPVMDGFEPALLAEDEGVLEARAAQAAADAAGLDCLRDEATEIRTRIADAKRTHAVEEALAEVSRCEDDLRTARERDVRSVVASALVDFVQGVTRDQHLPAVFHRARDLFVQITHGRYRLDFDDGRPPAFRAFDTTTGVGHPLEELSSATRVQLLMAVRLAFVETQEQGVRLPILFDETLGNSDDARAAAIMEALLELVAQGRQVFYFTAQPDEVGKWKGLLEGREGVEAAFIDLAKARRLARTVELPGLRVVGAPQPTVPPPGEMSHAEYGQALGVPVLDPFASADTAHVWYLVEDTDALHGLLSGLRAERWGALRSLVDHGGGALVEPELYGRAAALSRALETALENWRVGRGRPVDRSVLEASGAVTDSFLEAVDEIRRECGGDGRQLLEALERGEVKRFRAGARESLQEYLEINGYHDDREVIDADELRARALASVADAVSGAVLGADDVDRLLARLDLSMSDPVPTL